MLREVFAVLTTCAHQMPVRLQQTLCPVICCHDVIVCSRAYRNTHGDAATAELDTMWNLPCLQSYDSVVCISCKCRSHMMHLLVIVLVSVMCAAR